MRHWIGLVLAVLALPMLGCAAAPQGTLPPAASIVAGPGQAKIVVARGNDIRAGTVAARIWINGTIVAYLWGEQTYAGVIPPGAVEFTVDSRYQHAIFSTTFNAGAGKEYEFEIAATAPPPSAGTGFGIFANVVDPIRYPTGMFTATLKEVRPAQ